MKTQKSLALNYIYTMFYQVLAIIVPLITTPYVARVLQANGLGEYSFAYSITTYFCLFGTLGLGTYGQLKIAETGGDTKELARTFWSIFAARTLTTLMVSCAYIIFIVFSSKYKMMYIVLSVCLVAQIFDISWFFQGIEEFKKIVVRNTIIKLISVLLIFLFVKKQSDLYLYALIVQGTILIGNLSLWNRINHIVPLKYSGKIQLREHLFNSLVFFIPAIATSVYTVLDKSMIGWITGLTSQNGYYEQAHKIEQILVVIVTALSTVTLPRLKHMFVLGNKNAAVKIIDNTIGFVMCVSLPMTVGVFILAGKIIPWFLGRGYQECVPLLQIFALLIVVVGLNNIVGKECLMATGRQKYYNVGVIVGAFINVILNLFLIPKLMAAGAAIASVISECIILGFFVMYSKDYIDTRKYIRPFLKYTLFSGLMGLVVVFVGKYVGSGTFGIFSQAFSGLVFYAFLLFISRDNIILKFRQ